MTKLPPEELTHATKLMTQAKFEEALKIVENLEKGESIKREDLLATLLIKARIYLYMQRFRNAVKTYDVAYQLSQDLGLTSESVNALIGKAMIGLIGDLDNGSKYVLQAENILTSFPDDRSTGMLRRNLLSIKSWISFFKANYNEATESAEECLRLTKEENLGNVIDLASTYLLLGWINFYHDSLTKALEYVMKSLELNKELNYTIVIPDDCYLIALIYYNEGKNDQAIQYCKQGLSIKEISNLVKVRILMHLSQINIAKGELDRALKYQLQAGKVAEESNFKDLLTNSLRQVGYTYRFMGKDNLAIEYCERSLQFAEKWDFTVRIGEALMFLILLYIDANSREKAIQYFSRLSELYEKRKEEGGIDLNIDYLMSKAYILKTSTRMRDHVEAQALFKELFKFMTVNQPYNVDITIWSMGNLCNLLFEELFMYDDPKILDEIVPLITESLKIVEQRHHYAWLANIKLLQAKLALIQTDIEEAKRKLVEAQQVAQSHGLNLLAWGISSEHDKLLDQVDVWDMIKKGDAPMSERIKLASANGVLDHIQGKGIIKSPDLVDEEPILLLIMDDSGATYFSHPFLPNWDYSDLFSSFLSGFNTFSDEIFSKSIDRVRIGENTILINPVEPFLACYVIKGQSYPALQKLTRFTEALKKNSEIWQALNKSMKTSEMLELDNPPALRTVINEIFRN